MSLILCLQPEIRKHRFSLGYFLMFEMFWIWFYFLFFLSYFKPQLTPCFLQASVRSRNELFKQNLIYFISFNIFGHITDTQPYIYCEIRWIKPFRYSKCIRLLFCSSMEKALHLCSGLLCHDTISTMPISLVLLCAEYQSEIHLSRFMNLFWTATVRHIFLPSPAVVSTKAHTLKSTKPT